MCVFFFFNDTATTEIYTLSLHDALPILLVQQLQQQVAAGLDEPGQAPQAMEDSVRAAVARLTRSGRLPLAGLGERGARALQSSVTPSLRAWRQQLDRYAHPDRKSTRLNSSHSQISYAVF